MIKHWAIRKNLYQEGASSLTTLILAQQQYTQAS